MIGFNVGVELGQLIALAIMLAIMLQWRRTASFERFAVAANALILTAGFVLMEYQLAAYFGGERAMTEGRYQNRSRTQDARHYGGRVHPRA